MKENFKIQAVDGKEYWISRSMAVTAVIFTISKEHGLMFLLEVRGEGCPDGVGKLAFPCGYLAWDETRRDAVVREVYEEIGIKLLDKVEETDIVEWMTQDDPNDSASQNVTTRYAILLPNLEEEFEEICKNLPGSENRGGEANEVSELKLLSLQDLNNLEDEDFAFNHKQVIRNFVDNVNRVYYDRN